QPAVALCRIVLPVGHQADFESGQPVSEFGGAGEAQFCGMPDGPSEEVVLPWGYTIALAAIHAVDGAVIHYTERIGVRIVGVLCVPVCKRVFYVGGELSLERMIIREQPSCVGHFAQHPGFAAYL